MRASTAARGALLALLCWAALPAPARAYEDQVLLGLDIGYARALANDDLPANGLLSGLSVDIGIGDAWAIRCRAAYAFHPGGRPLHLGLAGAEVVYLLDILELVPFFGLGVDGILTQREDDGTGVDLALHAVLGLDWLVTREWVVGLDIRAYALPFSLADQGVDPVYLGAGLRLGYVFDRF